MLASSTTLSVNDSQEFIKQTDTPLGPSKGFSKIITNVKGGMISDEAFSAGQSMDFENSMIQTSRLSPTKDQYYNIETEALPT